MGLVKSSHGRAYIEGVRQVSWASGEMCEFASALVSALGSLGEAIPYHYVMGTSGVAFRFTLNPGAWDYGNYGILNVSPEPFAPIERAFAAVGYAYTRYEPGAFAVDAARIMGSIDRGVPVLAFGVVGPSDCCVITGYDECGAVLLGWSTFQDIPDDHDVPPDVTGYFRKPGWHEHIPGYILIGARVGRPPLRAVYLDSLRWAVHLLRSPWMGRKATGPAALRLWADEMAAEQNFPADDAGVMTNRYLSTAINMTMLRDHCLAHPFLTQAADDVPDFCPELSLAADCYAEVIRLREGMDGLIADNFAEQAIRAIADPQIRRAYADAILRIRAAEERAATHIERLLARCA